MPQWGAARGREVGHGAISPPTNHGGTKMGIDKSLNDNYPSVIINGTRYHFGRHPGPDDAYFLVENASYAKDYWWFEHEDDFLAFLVNLPQSADRQRHLKLHPDWHDVTHEQRDAYIEGDRARLREM